MSSTGSVNRKRSKSRSRDASRSPAKSRHRSDRSKKRRRSSSQTNQREPNSSILEQLLDKISSLSSTVDKLNERMTSLESAPVKDTDNMVAEQEDASCPEPTDVSDQLSVVVRPDPEIESYGPVILDPNSSHRVGNITSKSLTQGHKNDTACLSENNNGDCGKNLSEAEGQPNQDSAKHLPFDPVAEAPSWEPSTAFKEFLEINFRRSLSSSQIFGILEETSLPDLDVLSAPKLDKAIADQIPKNYKKSVENRDKELIKVQRHVINVGAPLTALHDLLESKQELSHDELLNLVERAICLLGNAANSISVLRRSKILYSINPSKISLVEAPFPNAGKQLFGSDITKIAADSADIVRNLQKNLNQQHPQSSSWSKPQLKKYQAKKRKISFELFRPKSLLTSGEEQISIPATALSRQTKQQLPLTGRLPYFIENWQNITQDSAILDIVQGFQIQFQSFPVQKTLPRSSLQNCKLVKRKSRRCYTRAP